ncbi:carbon storage regulator [Aeoliella sp. SH292]|uniref:carbon storage regulator n=1 Tax=Aeoliella sp. SH292 TaxID=3454464 RepID=UPI003F9C1BD3
MVVMSREVGQSIRIEIAGHGEAVVAIHRIVGDRVEFSLEVPSTAPVCRGEVLDAPHGAEDRDKASVAPVEVAIRVE